METRRGGRKPKATWDETIYSDDSQGSDNTITDYDNSKAYQNSTQTTVYCSDCGFQNVYKQGLKKCTNCKAKFVAQTASESVLDQNRKRITEKVSSAKEMDKRGARKPKAICEETKDSFDSRGEGESTITNNSDGAPNATLTSYCCSDCSFQNAFKPGLKKCTNCTALVAQTVSDSVINQNLDSFQSSSDSSSIFDYYNISSKKRSPEEFPTQKINIKIVCQFRSTTFVEKKAGLKALGKNCIEIEGELFMFEKALQPLDSIRSLDQEAMQDEAVQQLMEESDLRKKMLFNIRGKCDKLERDKKKIEAEKEIAEADVRKLRKKCQEMKYEAEDKANELEMVKEKLKRKEQQLNDLKKSTEGAPKKRKAIDAVLKEILQDIDEIENECDEITSKSSK